MKKWWPADWPWWPVPVLLGSIVGLGLLAIFFPDAHPFFFMAIGWPVFFVLFAAVNALIAAGAWIAKALFRLR